jgi:hypothetical protein
MEFNRNLSTIHGYLCADGYVSTNLPHQKHKYYSIGFRNTNNILLKDFQENFYKVFNIKPKLIEGQRCILYSKEIYYILMQNGPYHSNNWIFPPLSNYNARYWLRAFFDCEGWIIADRRQTRSICSESIRQEQLPIIQNALKNFQINSKIYKRKNRKTAILTIPDKQSIINFKNEIGFLHPKKKEKLVKCINSFVDYNWNISNTEIRNLMHTKSRLHKPYTIRLFSIIKKNLEQLSCLLKEKYSIESKIYRNKNSQGTIYFYLSVQKKEEVKKLVSNSLLNKEITKTLSKIL